MQLYEFHNNPEKIQKLLREVFIGDRWVEPFFNSSHHGFEHGNDVRKRALSLINRLTDKEKLEFEAEGDLSDDRYSIESVSSCVEISAIFHDCGRINNAGNFIHEDQNRHHIIGARRVKIFCERLELSAAEEIISEAVLSHDYQSRDFTPNLNPPVSMVGKILQASDQIGWFHPDSVNRTLKCNEDLGVPFFNSKFNLQTRLRWQPNVHNLDAITVMLHQLFGICDEGRFGIKIARDIIEDYKIELRKNIIKMAESFGVKKEIEELIIDFEQLVMDRS